MDGEGDLSGEDRRSGTAQLVVLLSGGALSALVQMAILPSLTAIGAKYTGQGGALDNTAIAQLVLTIAATTMAIGSPVAGWVAGRWGKRPLMLASLLVYALAGTGAALAPNLWIMLATRLLLGLAAAGVGTAGIAMIGDFYAGRRRDKLIGVYASLGSAGALVGLPVAGLLADRGWQVPLSLYLVAIPLFLLGLVGLREPPRPAAGAITGGGGSLRAAYGLFALTIALSFVLYMVSVQGPFLLAAEGITDPSKQSLIIDMATAGSMTAGYLFGYVRPRLGFAAMLTYIWVMLGIACLGFGLVHGVLLHCVFAAINGLGSGFIAPLTQSAILNVVSAEARPRALGLGFGLIFLGMFVQPFLVAPLRAAVGIDGAFVWIGAAAIAIGAVTLVRSLRAAQPHPA